MEGTLCIFAILYIVEDRSWSICRITKEECKNPFGKCKYREWR